MNWKRIVLVGVAAAGMSFVGCRNTNEGVGGSGNYGRSDNTVNADYLNQDKAYGEPGGTGGSGQNAAGFIPVCGGPNGSRF